MNKKIIIGIISFVIMLAVGVTISNLLKSEKGTIYIQTDLAVDPENLVEMIEYSDYVFIGTVKEYLGNISENTSPIPYSKYKITVDENIKGELINNIEVKKIGGYDNDNNQVLIDTGTTKDFLPKINEQYIFIATAQSDGSIVLMAANGNVLYGDLPEAEKLKIKKDYKNSLGKQTEIEPSLRQRFKSKYEK